jgi:hypothetical protein
MSDTEKGKTMASYLTHEPQEEFLNAIRTGQQAVVEAVKTWVDTVKAVTPQVPSIQVPFADRLPAAEDVVASVYDFAEKLLANQRQFAGELLKVTAPLLPGNDGVAAQ